MSVTWDLEYLDGIALDPELYAMVADDFTPARGLLSTRGLLQAGGVFYRVRVDGAEGGWILLLPKAPEKSSREFELHLCLTPICRGKLALDALKQVLGKTGARVVARVPDYRLDVLMLVGAAGFVRNGWTPNAGMKAGQAYGYHVLEHAPKFEPDVKRPEGRAPEKETEEILCHG